MKEYTIFYNLGWGTAWKVPRDFTVEASSDAEAEEKAKRELTERYSKLKSYKGKRVEIECVQDPEDWDYERCSICGKCPKEW